jgi:hypothetical protein
MLEADTFSFEVLERSLALPRGSARKRRLFLLAVRAPGVPGTELRRGDRLVVEPGSRASPGRLVVCQADGVVVLRSVRRDAHGAPLLAPTDPQLLPLPDARPCAMIGTIIASLRVGADRRIRSAWPPSFVFGLAGFSSQREQMEERLRSANAASLDAAFRMLDAEARSMGFTPAARRLGAARSRLHALRGCLDAVQDERLYRALAREINTNLKRLKRDLAGSQRWALLADGLHPLICDSVSYTRGDLSEDGNAQRHEVRS